MARGAGAGVVGISLRIDLPGLRIGPGKVALLEAIAATGSISGAGRALGMSYKRAWDLLEQLNRASARPLAAASPGGSGGGGTVLTEAGARLVQLYRAIEAEAAAGGTASLREMAALVAEDGGAGPSGGRPAKACGPAGFRPL